MIIDTAFARELAAHLLDINAVILRPNEPFTWASGWHSPIYCDNRLTLQHPEIRKKIAAKLADIITKEFPKTEVITGTATAGIPHAAWVADILDKPMAYVRAKAKAYGMGNQIEGGVAKGQPTVVIEDLISTGGSAISVINALQFVGADVQAIISIFNYGFDRSVENFEKVRVPVYNLTDYTTLVDVAVENGFVTSDDLEHLANWRNHPDTWPN
ncbi:MAG: orotate phosphoribosyltransferase [Balneola sp.]